MPNAKLQKLNSSTSTSILTDLLKDQPNLACQYIESSSSIINRVTYFIDKEKKQLIFATPLGLDQVTPCLLALQKKLEVEHLDDYSLVLSTTGDGITERHIVTLYKPKGFKEGAFVIDSKTSDPNFFFRSISVQKPGFLQNPHSTLSWIFRAVKGVFRALIPNYQNTLPVKNFYFNPVQYLSTGHQSYFDGISCGYHTLSTMLKLVILESEGLLPTKETLTPEKLRKLLAGPVSNDALIREKLPNALANKNRLSHSHPVSARNDAVSHRVKEPTPEKQNTPLTFVLRPTQLSSTRTPFEPELKTRESEPLTKSIPSQKENSIDSFVVVDREEDYLLKKPSTSKQNSTNPSSGNLVFWKLLLFRGRVPQGDELVQGSTPSVVRSH